MSASVLHHPGDSRVHHLPAHVKIVCAVAVVFGVVAIPRTEFWAFGVCGCVLTVVWMMARVRPGWLAHRAAIEAPFVLLAVVLPITGGGPRTELLGVSLSVEGLLAGWNIVVKGTLGVLVSLTLAATTGPEQIVAGLGRLRAPGVVTMIAGVMLRYVEVLVDEARRMRRARLARGDDPRLLWQGLATARGVGALFLRAYERGERVHLAMLARGWSRDTARGPTAPPGACPAAGPARWVAGLTPAIVVGVVCAVAVWGG